MFGAVFNSALASEEGYLNSDSAEYGAKIYIDLIRKCREQGNYDSTLFYCEQLIVYANRFNSKDLIVRANYQKIITYEQFGKYNEAFRLALLTEKKYCDDIVSDIRCRRCDLIYTKISEYMMVMENKEESLRYLELICDKKNGGNYAYKKAELYIVLDKPDSALIIANNYIQERLDANDSHALIGAYNQLGLIAKKAKKYEIALAAFNQAIVIIDLSGKRKQLKPILLGNVGSCYFELNQLKLAYDYLLQDSKGSFEMGEISSYISAEITLAEIENKWNQYSKAINRLEFLLANFEEDMIQDYTLEITKSLISLSKTVNQSQMYLFYTDKLIGLNNDVNELNNNKYQDLVSEYSAVLIAHITKQLEMENELVNHELIILKKEDEKKLLRNTLLFSLIILSFMVVLFFFWKYKSVQVKKTIIREAKLRLAEQQQEILEIRVREENRNVHMLSLELIAKKDFSSLLLGKLKKIESVSPSDLRSIALFIQNELGLKTTRAKLHNDLDKVGSKFLNTIRREHKNLTDLDLKLATMIVMKMPNKEIAISKNITTASVKISKNRLKKKLGLPIERNLSEYLIGLT